MAIAVDQHPEITIYKIASLEFFYRILYYQWSNRAHADLPAIVSAI